MRVSSYFDSRTILTVALLVAGIAFCLERPVHSYPADDELQAVKWDYTSVTVEALSIQAKLTELGIDGWDVFSITRADSVVNQGADGQTRVTSEKYQVTARKPLK